LTDGTKYFYKVKAVNATGVGSVYSSEVSAIPVAPPSAPTGLSAVQSGNVIQLAWALDYSAKSINIYRSTTPGGESATPTYTGVPQPTYQDSAVTQGVKYYYEITAVTSGGESPKSTEVSCVAPTRPIAPTGLTVGTITSTSAAFTWNAVSGATAYDVLCSTTPGGEATGNLSAYVAGPTGTVNGLTSATKYYAVVESWNGAGATSLYSNEVSFTTQLLTPTNLTATWQAGGSVLLTWTASPGATSYSISRYPGLTGPLTSKLGTASGATYVDTTAGAEPIGTILGYNVDAATATATDPGPANVEIQQPIAAPTGVTAVGAFESVVLTWSAPAGGNTYVIKRANALAGPYTVYDVTGTSANPATLTDTASLADNTTYYYIVGSEYLDGTGNFSEVDAPPVAATTAPVTPASLTATASLDKGIVLTWPASPGATSYNVLESPVSGGVYGVYANIGSTASNTFTVTGLADSTPYYFIVTAQNAAGTVSNPSPEATATTWAPTPYLTQVTGNAKVTLNWTPVTGALGYTIYRCAKTDLNLVNISGSTLLTTTSFVDSTVSNGTQYFYAVTYSLSYGPSVYSNIVASTPNATGAGVEVYQINSGGPAVGSWMADKFTSSPSAYSTSNVIDLSKAINAAPEAVYQTCGVCNLPFTYTITGLTANAPYVVRLHFGDAFDTLPGQRVVNISIQGVTITANYDPILVAGGPNIATVAQFNATANSSGVITVGFTGIANYPIVSGVEIVTGSTTPTAPFGLIATAGSGKVSLVWNGFTGLTGYNVYRATSANGVYTLLTASHVTTTSYTDTAVTAGTNYFYVVTSLNSVGESLWSNYSFAKP
jgi:fibronectin type 3 domain-containing protein